MADTQGPRRGKNTLSLVLCEVEESADYRPGGEVCFRLLALPGSS